MSISYLLRGALSVGSMGTTLLNGKHDKTFHDFFRNRITRVRIAQNGTTNSFRKIMII